MKSSPGGTSPLKVWLVARKSMVELLREPQLMAMLLLFPLFMLGLNAIGYGTAPRLATYPVLIYDPQGIGQEFTRLLSGRQYDDGRPIFRLSQTKDLVSAEEALKNKSVALLIIVSAGPEGKPEVTERGDGTNMAFTQASVQIDKAIKPGLDQAAGRPPAIQVEEKPLSTTGPISNFDAFAPGIMIFSILFLIPQTATLISRELRTGTFTRLQLTPLSGFEYLAGISLAQMILGTGEVLVMFLGGLAMGFHPNGSILLGLLICLGLSFSAIGLGLVVACFSNTDSEALNNGSIFTMLQVFLSGALFGMPAITVFALWGYEIGIFDFIPATHGMLALTQVLVWGAPFSQVVFRMGAMAALSLGYFAISLFLFERLKLRKAKE